MRIFIEKLFILIFCLYNTYKIAPSKDLVFFFLVSMTISLALDLFNQKKSKVFIYLIFLLVCIYDSFFIYYLPLIVYNMYSDFKIYSLFVLPLLLIDFSILNIILSTISIYLSIQTNSFDQFLNENRSIRDSLKEDAIYLRRYNEQLKIDREKNIHIAVLTERNRIAREIHDSIGHSISSSILQVEALKVISDDNTIDGLNLLQNTLSNGMDDIRSSIHNLYNESLDLMKRIEQLCEETSSLDININYKLEEQLPYDLKFDILSIIRESITNCVKHSKATKLNIILLTQPNFHTIIVKDNGKSFIKTEDLFSQGIGLLSMDEIARKYDGFLNYEFEDGFKIHITLMKG